MEWLILGIILLINNIINNIIYYQYSYKSGTVINIKYSDYI